MERALGSAVPPAAARRRSVPPADGGRMRTEGGETEPGGSRGAATRLRRQGSESGAFVDKTSRPETPSVEFRSFARSYWSAEPRSEPLPPHGEAAPRPCAATTQQINPHHTVCIIGSYSKQSLLKSAAIARPKLPKPFVQGRLTNTQRWPQPTNAAAQISYDIGKIRVSIPYKSVTKVGR